MKNTLTLALIGALLVPLAPLTAEAGTISRACMSSDRKAKSRSLCNCIQRVANKNLSNSEQRLAATFFKDPHKAQVIRQSDSFVHERFWKKYKKFGSQVASGCKKYR